MTSINSNVSATQAQANLKIATENAQRSVSKLSSGNRISRAADDVAGLAIGTTLKTNVNTLKTALSNTSQASSLLSVADAGLAQIGQILQRQKALSVQANSGTLSSTERGFLNQEFQSLKSEIDRIASTSKFNAVNLLNGSLNDASTVTGDVSKGSRAKATFQITTAFTTATTFTLNGAAYTFVAAGASTNSTQINIGAGASIAETVSNIAAKINGITDVTAAADASASKIKADITATDTISFYSKEEGTVGNFNIAIGGAAGAVALNGAGGVTNASGTLLGGTNGALIAGRVTVPDGAAGAQVIGDSLLTATVNQDFSHITGNKDFVGKLSGFKATYLSADKITAELKVGDYTYKTTISDTTPTAAASIRFTSEEAGGGYFDLQLAAAGAAVTNQTDADTFARRLSNAVGALTFYQERDVLSYKPGGTIFDTDGTTSLGSLAGSSFDIIGDDYKDVTVSKFEIIPSSATAGNATIRAVINGELYENTGEAVGAIDDFDLVSVTDPRKQLQFTIGTGTLDASTATKAAQVQKAFETAFGIGQAGSAAKFQTGLTSSDSIAVAIKDASSSKLYEGKTLSIATVADAQAASDQLDKAIANVNSIRADVGALQSRFDYAAANIEASAQNLDSARAKFLDTDVAEESTNYARFQVLSQAGISILAQANQLPQSLLKLIG